MTTTTKKQVQPVLLIDGHHGIYIPKMFAEEIIAGAYICPNKRELLWQWGELSNPDNEQYWGAWDTVLNNCILEDKWGNKFTLYQNDDLWAVPEGYDVEEFFQ